MQCRELDLISFNWSLELRQKIELRQKTH